MTSPRPSRHPVAATFSWLLLVLLVLFPKGGIKLGDVPLTWGYLLLAGTIPVLLIVRVLLFPLQIKRQAMRALLLLLPLQLLIVYAYMIYGISYASFAFSTFVSLFILPALFLLIYPSFLPLLDGRKLATCFRYCILLAALWGIVLFIQYPVTGHITEIPYLTVNAQDAGLIEATKHISRGPFLKLISTYNNGNLYGSATLLLLPLYDGLEPSRWRRAVLKIALLLTLSRTVWFGLVFNEAIPLIGNLFRQLPTFPIVRFAGIGRRLFAIVFTAGLVMIALLFITENAMLAFLFDPHAGGRIGDLSGLTFTLLPNTGLAGFSEIIYLSALQDFGLVGLIAMVLLMASPLLLLLWDRRALRSPLRLRALQGLMVYALVAFSDGGFNFIPVMAFYWFVYMIYLFDWPAFAPLHVRARRVLGNQFLSGHSAISAGVASGVRANLQGGGRAL